MTWYCSQSKTRKGRIFFQVSIGMNWVMQLINYPNGQTSPNPYSFSSSSFRSTLYVANFQRNAVPLPSSSLQPPLQPLVASSSTRISPTVLFIIVILAVIFFISGLLHLLIRFLTKQQQHWSNSSSHSDNRYPRDISGSEALQRQLQQLFHLHDSGLDQAFIDALPVFLYKEIVGAKEPFDCAVCLCEFADEDKLRLLPLCSHAFHLNCIDTWLLSNSTCPLCRGSLSIPGFAIQNPVFDFSSPREAEAFQENRDIVSLPCQKSADLEEGTAEAVSLEKKVFSVRLGKFRSLCNETNEATGNSCIINNITDSTVCREEGESSSSSLDARRCYSMGSFQYVVGDSILQVALNTGTRKEDDDKNGRKGGLTSNPTATAEGLSGKRLCVGNKGESFSVSKIWQWSSDKGKFPIPSDTVSLDGSFPWIGKNRGGDT